MVDSVGLADINNEKLVAFSGDDHSYFGGNARAHWVAMVSGDLQDSLE